VDANVGLSMRRRRGARPAVGAPLEREGLGRSRVATAAQVG